MSLIGRVGPFLTGGGGVFAFTISTNQSNANLRSLAIAAGWNTTDAVVATVAAGVSLMASVSTNAGLTVDGSFPGGVSLVIASSASIGGYGGLGGLGGYGSYPTQDSINGRPGGTALLASVAVTVTNNGSLIGGGGGGGGNGGNVDAASNMSSGASGGAGARIGVAKVTNGGDVGSLGSSGAMGFDYTSGQWTSSGSGGAAGKSVSGNSNIIWLATGTRTGPIA